jgi:hypothetical protein
MEVMETVHSLLCKFVLVKILYFAWYFKAILKHNSFLKGKTVKAATYKSLVKDPSTEIGDTSHHLSLLCSKTEPLTS